MRKIPSQNDRVLALLRTGPKSTHEILREVPCIVHSRISELRKAGHDIVCRREGVFYWYRLVLNEAAGSPSGWDDPGNPSSSAASLSTDTHAETDALTLFGGMAA